MILLPCGGLVDWMLICDKSDRWTLKEKRQEWPYWRWHLITRVSNVLWQDTGRLSRRPWFEATCCSICNYVFSSLAQNKGKYSQTSSSCKSLCVGRRWTVLAAAVQLFSSVTPWMAKKVVMNEEQWIIKCQCGQWVQMKTKEQLKAWIESGQPSFWIAVQTMNIFICGQNMLFSLCFKSLCWLSIVSKLFLVPLTLDAFKMFMFLRQMEESVLAVCL